MKLVTNVACIQGNTQDIMGYVLWINALLANISLYKQVRNHVWYYVCNIIQH